jgi:hypothetical protein
MYFIKEKPAEPTNQLDVILAISILWLQCKTSLFGDEACRMMKVIQRLHLQSGDDALEMTIAMFAKRFISFKIRCGSSKNPKVLH